MSSDHVLGRWGAQGVDSPPRSCGPIVLPAARGGRPGSSRPVRSWGASWPALLTHVVARGYVTAAGTLLVASLAPLLLGWEGYLVRSGSMEPTISSGDVIAAAPYGPSDGKPKSHEVLAFRAVAPDGGTRVLVHRVVGSNGDGTWMTAGDANPQPDSDALSTDMIVARPRLLVRWIGLPRLWLEQGAALPLTAWAAITMLALALVPARRFTGEDGPRPAARPGAGPPPAAPRHGAGAPHVPVPRGEAAPLPVPSGAHAGTISHGTHLRESTHRWPHRATTGMALLALAQVLLGGGLEFLPATEAAFSAATVSAGSVWTTPERVVDAYGPAVMVDRPWGFYPLDDSSAEVMLDASGDGRDGSYAGAVRLRVGGAMLRVPDHAVALAGTRGTAIAGSGAAPTTAPTTYSVELWFISSSTTGGRLVGFESTTAETSPVFDRVLLLQNDGRLSFGRWGTQSDGRILVTPLGYADGRWHHVVVTSRPQGSNARSSLYVDGSLVVEGTTTPVTVYPGWWRVGSGAALTGLGWPTNPHFTGSVDNLAIYSGELPATRVAAHFAAR